MVVACSLQSAAVDVTHHTGPLTDVSLGMLGWSVLQRRRQTPEALEAEQGEGSFDHPPHGCQWQWTLPSQLLRTACKHVQFTQQFT